MLELVAECSFCPEGCDDGLTRFAHHEQCGLGVTREQMSCGPGEDGEGRVEAAPGVFFSLTKPEETRRYDIVLARPPAGQDRWLREGSGLFGVSDCHHHQESLDLVCVRVCFALRKYEPLDVAFAELAEIGQAASWCIVAGAAALW